MSKQKPVITEYRNYYLPTAFPVLALSGDHWRISDVISPRLHFHNCLEIGICHTDSGFMTLYGQKTPFRAGDVTVVPRNVPHTTYSAEGTASLWSYLFIEPRELFKDLLPDTWENYDLLSYDFQNFQYMFNKETFPEIHHLACMAIDEIVKDRPGCQLAARGLLFALYIEIYRVESAARPESFDQKASTPRVRRGSCRPWTTLRTIICRRFRSATWRPCAIGAPPISAGSSTR